MASYATEEEQIAALKRWWSDNGNSLLIGICIALILVFGWKLYQNSVTEKKAAASVLYQELVGAATQTNLNKQEEQATVGYLADKLKNDYPDTEYALYASLFIAKDKVAAGEFDAAKAELDWALNHTQDMRMQHIITARLARVLSAQGKNDEALALLVATDASFEGAYLEIIGDIKKRLGDEAGAIEAYKQAYAIVKFNPEAQPLLAVKLSDLGINPETL